VIEKYAQKSARKKETKKRRVAGTMEGLIIMPLPDDFDEPLEDLKEYRS
jgi:Protein of unknown function (DUF2281)